MKRHSGVFALSWLPPAFAMAAVAAVAATPSEEFLFGEPGNNLLVADVLHRGGRLYADVFNPYGPLPAALHAAAAFALGNTPLVFLLLLAAISAVNVALAAALIRPLMPPLPAAIFLALATPLLVIPGSLVGGFVIGPYLPLERTVLLALALCWRPAAGRSPSRGWALGLLIGSWQLVKFGGVVPASLALLIADLASWRSDPARPIGVRRWLSLLVRTAAGLLVIEALLAAWALAYLPKEVASDVLWPSFMRAQYSWVGDDLRWPHWVGWRAFVVQYLPALTGFSLALWGLLFARRDARASASPREAAAEHAVLIPLWFFLAGIACYFQHVNHFRQFAWALLIPGALGFARLRPPGRLGVVVLCVPAAAVFARAALLPRVGDAPVQVTLEGGFPIAVRAETRLRLERLDRVLSAAGAATAPVSFLPNGAGWHVLTGVRPPGRHAWVMPGFIRPYEEQRFVREIGRAAAIVVCRLHEEADARDAGLDTLPWPSSVRAAVPSMVGPPVVIDEGCAVYPVVARD